MRERTAELEAANRELQAFSYTVSHDLRGPLRAIIGFSSMLAEKGGRRRGAGSCSRRIERNAQRLGQMVDDLLDFSAPRARRALRAALRSQSAGGGSRSRARAPAYPRAVVTAGPLPEMTGDRGLLRQVFENLIGNALKFSAKVETPGGRGRRARR